MATPTVQIIVLLAFPRTVTKKGQENVQPQENALNLPDLVLIILTT